MIFERVIVVTQTERVEIELAAAGVSRGLKPAEVQEILDDDELEAVYVSDFDGGEELGEKLADIHRDREEIEITDSSEWTETE